MTKRASEATTLTSTPSKRPRNDGLDGLTVADLQSLLRGANKRLGSLRNSGELRRECLRHGLDNNSTRRYIVKDVSMAWKDGDNVMLTVAFKGTDDEGRMMSPR